VPTTFDALVILLVLGVPGYITRTVIASSVPQQQRSAEQWVSEIAVFGAIDLLLVGLGYVIVSLFVPLPSLATLTIAELNTLAVVLVYAACFIVVPALVGLALATAFERGQWKMVYRKLGLKYTDPAPRAWDGYFSQQRQRGVVVTLTDGTRIAGFMGKRSLASAYPAPEDLYLERAYRIENGIIDPRPVAQSDGVWIQGTQISYLEFYVPIAEQRSEAAGGT
jgi:uncharacterized protein DUF6338